MNKVRASVGAILNFVAEKAKAKVGNGPWKTGGKCESEWKGSVRAPRTPDTPPRASRDAAGLYGNLSYSREHFVLDSISRSLA